MNHFRSQNHKSPCRREFIADTWMPFSILRQFDIFENRNSEACKISKMRGEGRRRRKKKEKERKKQGTTRKRDAQPRCGLRGAREVKPLGKTLGIAAHFYAERRRDQEDALPLRNGEKKMSKYRRRQPGFLAAASFEA